MFLLLLLFGIKAQAEELCRDRNPINSNLRVISQIPVQANLNIPQCQDLRSLIENIEETKKQTHKPKTKEIKEFKILEDFEKANTAAMEAEAAARKQMALAYNKCQTGLFETCYPKAKAISETELNKLYPTFRKDPYLKMTSPEVHCFQRAQILAHRMAESGYEVQVVKYTAPSLVGLIQDDREKSIGYFEYSEGGNGHHYAVSISVQSQGGKIEKRILDPQFMSLPMREKDYSKALTGADCREDHPTPATCTIQFGAPTSFGATGEPSQLLQATKQMRNLCGWHDLEQQKNDIMSINSSSINSMTPLSPDLQNLSDQDLRKALQIKNVKTHIKNFEDSIKRSELAIQNLEKGIIQNFLETIDLNDPKHSEQTRAFYKDKLARDKKAFTKLILQDKESIQKLNDYLKQIQK